MKWKPWAIVAIFFVVAFSLTLFLLQKKSELLTSPYSKEQFVVGAHSKITVYDKGKEKLIDEVFNKLLSYEKEIEVNEPGESLIDHVNENAGESASPLSKDVYQLVKKAKKHSEATNGNYDLAIGAATSLWHIGFKDAKVPSDEEVAQVLPLLSYKDVHLDDQKKTVHLPKNGMKLDFGGIGKGWMNDLVLAYMKEKGVTTGIINIAGNIYVLGDNPAAKKNNSQKNWQVGIKLPIKGNDRVIGEVSAKNEYFSTSGIYERYITVNGQNYSHIMNWKTGRPINNELTSVTVVGKDGVECNTLSVALMNMGLEKGLEAVQERKGVEAIFITKGREVYTSNGLKKRFTLTATKEYQMGQS